LLKNADVVDDNTLC